MTNPIVIVKNLSVRYGSHEILHDVSFSVPEGEIVAIIGPNGSGKTTLLRAILNLAPFTGSIRVFGAAPKDLDSVAARIGYVPQRLDIDRSMPLSVEELLRLFSRGDARHCDLHAALRDIDASPLIHRRIGALSGGEFQRVLLALALLGKPELLILDEPLAGLDVEGEGVFYELLEKLREKRKLTALIISHDLSAVYQHATRVVCINHRMLCTGTPKKVLTHKTLDEMYGGRAFYAHH
jgi:ABC-type Mn2+/Zn2+ transport system ATPase subunit